MLKIIDKPTLPDEVFKVPASPVLLAQAVRVHLANQRQGTQSALTRAEVSRTRKKLYKQKGTGGARHGDRKAPIFVGGGISFAPKPRDHSLSLNSKMRRVALFGALTQAVVDKKLEIVSGLSGLEGKTKPLAKFLGPVSGVLIVTDQILEKVWRAGRNIAGLTVIPVNQLNAFEIMKAKKILMMEEAIEKLTPSDKISLKEKTKVEKPQKEKTPKVKKKIVKKISKVSKKK